ncbi:MAG: hypothetical protein LJE85_13870 [Gammaproteobacteria bacterium]|nr:hypothetical protein [Gammaproteobacteria bacterium]
MRAFHIFVLALFIVASAGCSSTPGETQQSGDQITVVMGSAVLDRPEKVQALRKYHGIEQMYDYLFNYMNRGAIRQSMKVHVSITEFRLGWGRDMMGIEVNVTENGEQLKRFHLVDTTGRGSQVKRLTKALAKRTFAELKEL